MGRRLKFLFFYFFCKYIWLLFFLQCFTIIIIKCKALFSCHSSSSHYSTQGFVLISFHFIFSFLIKNKKNKILCNFRSDLLFCLRISDLKCRQKTPKWMGPWEKMFPFIWLHLLAIISRNVGTKGHLRKEIVLLKYQVFRFGTKSGGQFELLNWLEKSTRLLMLEDYDLVHFLILIIWKSFKLPTPQSLGLWFSECCQKWNITVSYYDKIE